MIEEESIVLHLTDDVDEVFARAQIADGFCWFDRPDEQRIHLREEIVMPANSTIDTLTPNRINFSFAIVSIE